MPYTERQRACLSAMGLVAWRLRDVAAPGAAPIPSIEVPAPAAGGASGTPSAEAPASPAERESGAVGGNAAEGSVPAGGAFAEPSAEPSDGPSAGSSDGLTAEPVVESSAEPGAGSPVEPSDGPSGIGTRPPVASSPAGSSSAAPPPDALPSTVQASPELPPDAEPLAAPALATPLPREPAALAAWLPDQPLAPFVWKERQLTRIGRDDAPLLVVVEREPADTLPLVGDAAELFERMLGAIGRTRRDTCQCVLAGAPAPGGDTVAAVAGTARAVTLVLVRELDGALDADGCRLPGEPFGGTAWCLPHPDVLLAEPLAKRQAWLVLKAVRQHLPLLS